MQKRFLALALFFLAAHFVNAQDMTPLPPMADQTTVTTTTDNNAAAPALPPLPSQDSSTATAANNSSAPALPPLPDQKNTSSSSSVPAMPPLPDQSAPGASAQASPAMPPLPDQNGGSSNAAPANPPLPGDQTQAAAPGTPAVPAKKKAAHEPRPWERTKHRANVIFAGWVNAKGGNESSRIAWTAQEVMNALAFHKYKVLHEEGKYMGQADADGKQWREITFSVPKSKKLTLPVYMRQVGKKVWLRVGPSEPPAFAVYSVAEVQKMREANLKALHLIQKEMGRRLGPNRIEKSWEAAYNYNRHDVVE